MDEPFSNLDRRTRILVREDTFAVLREAGATAILVTHDQDDAMRMADRILMMQSGRIVQGGTGLDLCRKPATLQVARFFAEWNEVGGVCRAGIVATPAGDFPAPALPDGAAAVVCIRPSGIRFGAAGRAGRIVSRHFLGETDMIHLAVPGLDQPLRVVAAPGTGPDIGEAVSFTVAPDDVLVFRTE
jgi:iron(III) transport system ATP-binding protein